MSSNHRALAKPLALLAAAGLFLAGCGGGGDGGNTPEPPAPPPPPSGNQPLQWNTGQWDNLNWS